MLHNVQCIMYLCKTSKNPQKFAVYFIVACPVPLSRIRKTCKFQLEVSPIVRQIYGLTKPSEQRQNLLVGSGVLFKELINKQCKYENFGVQDWWVAGSTCCVRSPC